MSTTSPNEFFDSLVGCRVRLNLHGVLVEGWIVENGYGYVGLAGSPAKPESDHVFNVAVTKIYTWDLLERSVPDTYPVGTTVRWQDDKGRLAAAVKTADTDWRMTSGGVVSWQFLLHHRPLTVLAESTVIAAENTVSD